jgi:hypothetical protein
MEKIKPIIKNCIESEKGKDILIVIIVILVGLGSFELGRLSKENSSSGVKILPAQAGEYLNQAEDQGASAILSENFLQTTTKISPTIQSSAGKNFFASSRGSKYYTISCSAGKTIKQENRVYFTTGEEAQQAGYALSSSCQ